MRDFCPWPIFLLPIQCEDVQATIVAVRPAHNSSVQLLQDAEHGGGGGRHRNAEHLFARSHLRAFYMETVILDVTQSLLVLVK